MACIGVRSHAAFMSHARLLSREVLFAWCINYIYMTEVKEGEKKSPSSESSTDENEVKETAHDGSSSSSDEQKNAEEQASKADKEIEGLNKTKEELHEDIKSLRAERKALKFSIQDEKTKVKNGDTDDSSEEEEEEVSTKTTEGADETPKWFLKHQEELLARDALSQFYQTDIGKSYAPEQDPTGVRYNTLRSMVADMGMKPTSVSEVVNGLISAAKKISSVFGNEHGEASSKKEAASEVGGSVANSETEKPSTAGLSDFEIQLAKSQGIDPEEFAKSKSGGGSVIKVAPRL